MKVRMSIWWFCPQNMLCVQSQCRATYVITHHTATVGHSGEYLLFLQSPEFCPVSLLEKPGVGPSHATQTHTCFEGHPLVCETTRQQCVEVSSAVLIYATMSDSFGLVRNNLNFHKPEFSLWVRMVCLNQGKHTRLRDGDWYLCRINVNVFFL